MVVEEEAAAVEEEEEEKISSFVRRTVHLVLALTDVMCVTLVMSLTRGHGATHAGHIVTIAMLLGQDFVTGALLATFFWVASVGPAHQTALTVNWRGLVCVTPATMVSCCTMAHACRAL